MKPQPPALYVYECKEIEGTVSFPAVDTPLNTIPGIAALLRREFGDAVHIDDKEFKVDGRVVPSVRFTVIHSIISMKSGIYADLPTETDQRCLVVCGTNGIDEAARKRCDDLIESVVRNGLPANVQPQKTVPRIGGRVLQLDATCEVLFNNRIRCGPAELSWQAVDEQYGYSAKSMEQEARRAAEAGGVERDTQFECSLLGHPTSCRDLVYQREESKWRTVIASATLEGKTVTVQCTYAYNPGSPGYPPICGQLFSSSAP
ncbi:MAG: hypothetical protein KC731_25180 [Myxococcales bacterium]|nr:hypothetical protein [Myxococcales bacterium]MCA9644930.1 hypothetical protein [Myxococcales bacterium]